MKTDTELQRDVLDELAWEPSIKAQDIGVTVKDGVVTMTGHVPTYSEKWDAESAVKRVVGVRAIAEELTVSLFDGHERNDTDLAQAAANAIDWNVSVPHGKVQVKVENGWLTLSGDTDWNYQRDAAHNAVRHLMGVKGVDNLMHVNPPVRPAISTVAVREKIESALKRNIMKDTDAIVIETDNGKVTLRGKVHSWQEHDDAGLAAWSSPGVYFVENYLTISYN
ncbi:MAG: BON domain-containing protein [Chloroflexota bacterium]